MSKAPSFELLGVHRDLVLALRRGGVQPTPFQARVLTQTTIDFADVLVDARAAGSSDGHSNVSGNSNNHSNDGNGGLNVCYTRTAVADRHGLATIFMSHCALSARGTSRHTAIVVAATKDSAAQLQRSYKAFAPHCPLEFHLCTSEGQPPPRPSRTSSPAAEGGVSAGGGEGGRVIIATLRVLRSWERDFFRTVTALAVEEAGRRGERQLEEMLRLLANAGAGPRGAQTGGSSNPRPVSPNVMLLYLGPVAKVGTHVRGRLSRRNRRYYHLQDGKAAGTGGVQTPSGTLPPTSNRLLYLLYLDEKDHEQLLRRVLVMHRTRRVALLTHHKEIKHLYQTIHAWGLYNTPGDSIGYMLRTDSVEKQDTTLTTFLRENNGNPNSNGTSALLVAWDAYTALDLMDVDVFIQYYPPQKSLTERERAEYVQVLHTTADPDSSVRGRRTVLLTFLTLSDFTLASFFMRQYGQSGHILNLDAQHTSFERCLRYPEAVLEWKQRREQERSGESSAGGSGSASHHINSGATATATAATAITTAAAAAAAAAAAGAVPLPRSMRHVSPTVKERETEMRGGNAKEGVTNGEERTIGAAGNSKGTIAKGG